MIVISHDQDFLDEPDYDVYNTDRIYQIEN